MAHPRQGCLERRANKCLWAVGEAAVGSGQAGSQGTKARGAGEELLGRNWLACWHERGFHIIEQQPLVIKEYDYDEEFRFLAPQHRENSQPATVSMVSIYGTSGNREMPRICVCLQPRYCGRPNNLLLLLQKPRVLLYDRSTIMCITTHDVLTMYLTPNIALFCATIPTPYHPQPLEPLTPQIHRAARHNSSP